MEERDANKEYWEEKDRRDKLQKEENGKTALVVVLGMAIIIAVVGGLAYSC